MSLEWRREVWPVPIRDGWVRLRVGGPDDEMESVLYVERDRDRVREEGRAGGRRWRCRTLKSAFSVSPTGGLSMGGKSRECEDGRVTLGEVSVGVVTVAALGSTALA